MLKLEIEYIDGYKGRVNVDGVRGLISGEDAIYLYRVANRLGSGLYVELGCYEGASALCLAQGMYDFKVDAHLITVDVFNESGLDSTDSRTISPFSIDRVRETFVERDLDKFITPVEGLTSEVVFDYKDKKFNFLFIDADHSRRGCKADFEAWSPLVKSGGEIVFDDNKLDSIGAVMGAISWPRYDVDRFTVFTKP